MSDSDHDRLPRALGKYRLLRLVGRGGMGTVYEAEDTSLRRRVALKLLAGDLAKRPGAAGRFLLEARAAARLNHSHVVTIFEVGRRDETLFIAMELAERGSVAGLLQREGQLPWREAVRIVRDACRGLVAAHAAQLIHRDLKPANLLLMLGGTVKLADFGLVKVLDSDLIDEPTSNRNDSTVTPLEASGGGAATWGGGELSTWSRTAAFLGTPHYMSPEQCRRDAVTEASDVYSLGATLYALIAGQPPFPGSQPLKVMFAHCGSRPPNLCETADDVPTACARVVDRCLAKQPHQRFRSATELLAALDELLCEPPSLEPTPPPVAIAAASSVPLAPPPPPPLPIFTSNASLPSTSTPNSSTTNAKFALRRRLTPTPRLAIAFLVPLALVATVAGLGVLGRRASSWLSADSSRNSAPEPARLVGGL